MPRVTPVLRAAVSAALVTLVGCASAEVASPQTQPGASIAPEGVEADVADLAFIAGDWELVDGEDVLTEHWGEPRGDCLMGSFRWSKAGGKVWMYEFLTMRNEGGGVTLRFRHFAGDLVGWEEKDAPITLRLVDLAERRAQFLHFGGGGDPWTMTFHRLDEDSLTITLAAGDSDAGGQAFAFHRQ